MLQYRMHAPFCQDHIVCFFLCHVICFADSSIMYRCWILDMNGRWRRIVMGMSSCLFCTSPKSTSMNLDDLHFWQYFASAYSFLNRMQSFGQACICSHVILSARRSFCASYMLFGRTWSSESRLPITVNKPSKASRRRLYCDLNVIVRPKASSLETFVLLWRGSCATSNMW
jgi:hypothetical protein